VAVVLGFFLIARPIRKRRQRELSEAKSAAQDDLIALSTGITDHHADVSIQGNPEAAEEQRSALSSYERGTAALDAARRARDMGAVSRAIAEGQYHLACAEALAAGQPRPDRRPSCFFDPRHGMSVSDVRWTPAEGGPGRSVPACSACAHKVEQGVEPEMRKVEAGGVPVNYVNAGFPGILGRLRLWPRPVHRIPARRGACAAMLVATVIPGAGIPTTGISAAGFQAGFGGGDFGGGDFGAEISWRGDFGGGETS
jgi:hypothetical protein